MVIYKKGKNNRLNNNIVMLKENFVQTILPNNNLHEKQELKRKEMDKGTNQENNCDGN